MSLSGSDHRQLKVAVLSKTDLTDFNPARKIKKEQILQQITHKDLTYQVQLSSGSVAYKRAINAVSNPDEYDINLLELPGVIHEYHPSNEPRN